MEDGRSNLCKGNSCYGQAKLPLERSWKTNNVPFTKENKYVILAIGRIGQNGQERDKLKRVSKQKYKEIDIHKFNYLLS